MSNTNKCVTIEKQCNFFPVIDEPARGNILSVKIRPKLMGVVGENIP